MPAIVNLTNIPAPYREKIHELVSESLNSNYLVIYCAKLEPNRQWKFQYGSYEKIFLSDKSKGYIHNNLSIWKVLNKSKPKIIIATGFNPTMLYSFIWALLNGAEFIPFTDGTFQSEKALSFVHRLARKIVFAKSKAFVGASNGSEQLYKSYKISKDRIFKSCLSIDNSFFGNTKLIEKEYTLMFSGQLIDGKMPLFFVEVARKVKERIGTCNVLILGSGKMAVEMEAMLKRYNIPYAMPGFIDQKQLPEFYRKSKLFLFPTKTDAWGIVANEAMAAGVPVITCKNAGVEDDLVINNVNGYVLPLDTDIWADKVINLLNDDKLYAQLSHNAYTHVQNYNFESAAAGIVDAINFVLN
jgi:glycosyltransferase involved in cell wall biosynthesis